MTVTYHGGNILRGTTAERTGGTWTNLPIGWIFIESNGLAIYWWNGTTWDLLGSAGGTLPVSSGGTGATTLTGVLKGNGTSAITAAAQLAVADGGTGAATLTGILKGNGTSAVTAVTAPSGAIVGDTDTIALSNKTIDAGLNSFKNLAVHPGLKKTGAWLGHNTGSSCAWGLLENALSSNFSGTGAANAFRRDSTGTREEWTTGATINSITGLRCNSQLHFERSLNPMMQMKIAMQQTTACRCTIGFTSNSAAIGTAGADPLANLSGVAFFYDSAVDGNWHIAQNSGGASSDRTTIANVAAADTSAHVFSIRAVNASTKFQYAYGSTPPDTTTTWTDVNTVIPAAATGLGSMFFMENTTGAGKTVQSWWWYVEQDP